MKKLLVCFLNVVMALASLAPKALAEAYNFAVVPQQSAQQLAKTWQPVFDEVYRLSGVELLFTTAPSIPDFEQRLSEGEYDFAYMNPYHYTVYSGAPGYRAFAKSENKRIKGILVVHQDSPYQSLADLNGQQLAFPAPLAFAATVLPRSHLQQADVTYSPFFVRTHDSVYLNVAQHNFAAGGGIYRTFNNMPEEVKNQLRVLWESPGYTPHALASHPGIPSDDREKISAAFYQLKQTEAGQALLKTLGISGFERAADADWDDVRALNISHH